MASNFNQQAGTSMYFGSHEDGNLSGVLDNTIAWLSFVMKNAILLLDFLPLKREIGDRGFR